MLQMSFLRFVLSGILQITGKGLQKATERQAEVNGGAIVRLDRDV